MALSVSGLGVADWQEIVDALLVAADHTEDAETAAHRQGLALRIGQALETLPPPRRTVGEVSPR
ncbi:hypothetical protein [Streptomyces sp. KAU_LT]|uniref:hypothetical protein n=1 Tax=Streptomyces sp. KAU_LT TaxID=3046669 RepID=UPI0024B85071|nr:hypothetical protein [Streptomyces sp. KAU_LT]MDI9836219.1 hypothetical protein [Streptomyces sp. KAU_LT]